MRPPLNRWARPLRPARWVGGRSAVLLAAGTLAGCVTLPAHVSSPAFVPRIVDREYGVVWETLQAALRNEGASGLTGDRQRGVIETTYRVRPGAKVVARGLLGEEETRNAPVQVRYSVRAHPLGPEKTEVRLRAEIQRLDPSTRQWVRAADDGSVVDAFWRRFAQDLAYYGARPETWRPEGPGRETSPPESGRAQGAPGREGPRVEPR